MEIRIAGLVNDSIVDGPGLRLAVFTQGCAHHCKGCHNPETHDFLGGRLTDTKEIIDAMADNPLLDGITLTGGDPFEQPDACAEIAKAAHDLGLNVWTYTGYLYEDITVDAEKEALLRETDILVDGPFVASKRSLELSFRGSANQRIIDVKQSFENGKAAEIEEYMEEASR